MRQRTKQEFEIPARGGRVFEIDKGDILKVIAVEGVQGVDLVAFNRADLKETLCVWLSRQMSGSFTKADRFYSKLPAARTMFTVLTDKPKLLWLSPGRCNSTLFDHLGHPGHANCQDTLAECMKELGLDPFDVPEVLNIFMTADFTEDGSYTYKAAEIQKGDSYDMVSEMNMVVAISNCPDDIHDYNEHKPKRIVIQVLEGESQ